jgi:hypothetical protein
MGGDGRDGGYFFILKKKPTILSSFHLTLPLFSIYHTAQCTLKVVNPFLVSFDLVHTHSLMYSLYPSCSLLLLSLLLFVLFLFIGLIKGFLSFSFSFSFFFFFFFSFSFYFLIYFTFILFHFYFTFNILLFFFIFISYITHFTFNTHRTLPHYHTTHVKQKQL